MCLLAANAMLERSRQPFWGLPVPSPDDAHIIGWILQYGNLKFSRLLPNGQVRSLPPSVRGGDFQMFDADAWRPYADWCEAAERAAASCRQENEDASVCALAEPPDCARAKLFIDINSWMPASAWFHNFPAIVADRRSVGDGSWIYSDATFLGVNPLADFEVNAILRQFVPNPSAVPRPLFDGMALWLALHRTLKQPSPSGAPWMVVYAPVIMNAPGSLSAFGADAAAPIVIHYPDGKGGWVTVDSSGSRGRMAPPPGAGPPEVPPPLPAASDIPGGPPAGGLWIGSAIVGALILGAMVYAARRPQ